MSANDKHSNILDFCKFAARRIKIMEKQAQNLSFTIEDLKNPDHLLKKLTFRRYATWRIAQGDLTLGEERYLEALAKCVPFGRTSQVIRQQTIMKKSDWSCTRSVRRAQRTLVARGEITVTYRYNKHGKRCSSHINLTGYIAKMTELRTYLDTICDLMEGDE